jgi:hypothetical protein
MDTADIVTRYEAGASVLNIAMVYRVSTRAVWKRLKLAGVETARRKYGPRQPQQTALCPLCCRVKPLVQDHCYSTGKCRDKICSGCNTRLGYIEHPTVPESVLRQYIEDWRERHQQQGVAYRSYDYTRRTLVSPLRLTQNAVHGVVKTDHRVTARPTASDAPYTLVDSDSFDDLVNAGAMLRLDEHVEMSRYTH